MEQWQDTLAQLARCAALQELSLQPPGQGSAAQWAQAALGQRAAQSLRRSAAAGGLQPLHSLCFFPRRGAAPECLSGRVQVPPCCFSLADVALLLTCRAPGSGPWQCLSLPLDLGLDVADLQRLLGAVLQRTAVETAGGGPSQGASSGDDAPELRQRVQQVQQQVQDMVAAEQLLLVLQREVESSVQGVARQLRKLGSMNVGYQYAQEELSRLVRLVDEGSRELKQLKHQAHCLRACELARLAGGGSAQLSWPAATAAELMQQVEQALRLGRPQAKPLPAAWRLRLLQGLVLRQQVAQQVKLLRGLHCSVVPWMVQAEGRLHPDCLNPARQVLAWCGCWPAWQWVLQGVQGCSELQLAVQPHLPCWDERRC
jgi:hypothetical protein